MIIMQKEITRFEKMAYGACRKIPVGRVSTYLEIAKHIKKPKSARSVGNALNKNPYAPVVPCHRVVKSDGSVGGFAFGGKKKVNLLKKEGVKIEKGKVVGFEKSIFKFKK
jgi:O-6-methylguanine DNA methyltransferase